jgi:hypothetical protein
VTSPEESASWETRWTTDAATKVAAAASVDFDAGQLEVMATR